MSKTSFWDEDEELEPVPETVEAEEVSEPESAPVVSVPVVDEGRGRGGAYRLDADGNRVRVSGTTPDGAKERNQAQNAGPFAGRKHRERP